MTHEPTRRIYRMWNRGRDVNATWTDGMRVPDEVPQIGTVDEICYWSDKFARECPGCGKITEAKVCPTCKARTQDAPGVFELYHHDCESHAPIYAPTSKPDSEAYLTVDKPNGKIHVTFLAYMAEITMRTNSGRKVVQAFAFSQSSYTPMYVLEDRRTLMIPWAKRPMVITGSKMRVTAHGLIN